MRPYSVTVTVKLVNEETDRVVAQSEFGVTFQSLNGRSADDPYGSIVTAVENTIELLERTSSATKEGGT